jgi:dihydrolipoamide dehydrogenase
LQRCRTTNSPPPPTVFRRHRDRWGPADYPAAIRAAQNKLSVACIDEWKNHDGSAAGGTCLNAGCIPSKALLESSELFHRVHEEFATHGIKVSGTTLDLAQMQKRKSGIVRTMTQGILALFKAAGVTPLQGHGKLLAGRKVEFTAHDGKRRLLTAKQVVLASGSAPIELRSAPFKSPEIVDSWGALEFESVPKRLAVIGAGVIGLERRAWRASGRGGDAGGAAGVSGDRRPQLARKRCGTSRSRALISAWVPRSRARSRGRRR